MVKTLYRNRRDKVIAGVCSGLADYSGLDVTLIRLIFIALAFFDGIGFFLYFLMMVIVPKQPKSPDSSANDYVVYGKGATGGETPKANLTEEKASSEAQTPVTGIGTVSNAMTFDGEALSFSDDSLTVISTRTYWIGLTLVALGMYYFVLPFLPSLKFEYLFAFALIGLGFYLTLRKS